MSGIIGLLALPCIYCGLEGGGNLISRFYGMPGYSFRDCLVTGLLAMIVIIRDSRRWWFAWYFILWYKDWWEERTKTHILKMDVVFNVLFNGLDPRVKVKPL